MSPINWHSWYFDVDGIDSICWRYNWNAVSTKIWCYWLDCLSWSDFFNLGKCHVPPIGSITIPNTSAKIGTNEGILQQVVSPSKVVHG